jgi:hypothetical protein
MQGAVTKRLSGRLRQDRYITVKGKRPKMARNSPHCPEPSSSATTEVILNEPEVRSRINVSVFLRKYETS